MALLPVELHPLRAAIRADGGEASTQLGRNLAREYATAILGHKDQGSMQVTTRCLPGFFPVVSVIGPTYDRTMLIRKAVRYRPETTPEQEHLLSRAAGCVRFVWNRALAMQKSYLDHQCGLLSYVDMAKCLTTWRKGEAFGFLSESPVHPQQWALKFLDRALKDAFDTKSPKRFPVFKKKGRHDSLRYPDPEQIKIDLRPQDDEAGMCSPASSYHASAG